MLGRTRLLRVTLAVLLIVAGALALARTRLPERRIFLADACQTPARVIEPQSDPSGRVAVVFHGLGASAAIMEPLGQSFAAAGWRVYLLDLAGHGRSRHPFSYTNVERCARAAAQYLLNAGRIRAAKTVLVGHSLGAAAAVRVASRVPVAATVAISPALLAVPHHAPPDLLILEGQFDFGVVKREAGALLRLAGGDREAPADFTTGRAARFQVISGELHGGMVIDTRVWRMGISWADRAVSSGRAQPISSRAMQLPLERLLESCALIVGLVLLAGPWESLLASLASLQPSFAPRASVSIAESGAKWRRAVVPWTIGSFFAVSLVALTRAPKYLRPVDLADGDWAALVALVTGLVLAVLLWNRVRAWLRIEPCGGLIAAVAGVSIVVAFAFALRPEFVEAPLVPARLWRWAMLVAFTWPYFLAEEVTLGPPGGWRRFALFLALRGIVWLAQAYALLVFWRWGLLLVLLVFGFGAVSVGQRLAADVLWRRDMGPVSAALFDAILAAGMLALVLPLR